MLFHSSLRRELTKSLGASLVVLMSIVMTMMLIRTLGLANRGNINPQDVMLVMWFALLGHLPTVINMALLVSTTSVLSRLYRDSEAVIWMSSGVSFVQLTGALLRVLWPVWLVVAGLSLVVWPWANQQSQTLQQRFAQRSNVDRVAPGQFQVSADGKSVFFVENHASEEWAGKHVLVVRTTPSGEQMVTASSQAELVRDDKGLRIEFTAGQMTQMKADGSWRVHRFDRYTLVIDESNPTDNDAVWPPKAMWSHDLLISADPGARGELTWRLGVALTSVNMVLLAIVLTSRNPRSGKSWSLTLLILAFLVYFNLGNLSQSWVNRQTLPWGTALVVLHLPITALALFGMAWRSGLLPTWRLKRSAA